jgi:hypothetical protein
MKVKSHLFSISRNPDSLFAAILGFILIQIFSKHSGIGISPDSVTYVSAARHMVEGKGFLSFDNLPVVDFPFGYPCILTIITYLTKLDPLQFGNFLNGILFGMLLYLCGAVMNGFQKPNAWYRRIILTCLLLNPVLQEVYSMLWSETVFLLLVLCFIVSMSVYLRKKTIRYLLVCAIISAIACLTRYAGLFLIITGVLLIFLDNELSIKKRIGHILIFSFLAFSGVLINILRNLLVTGVSTGNREKNDTGILKIAEYFGGVFCDLFGFSRSPGLAILLTVAVLMVFILTIYFNRMRHKTGYHFEYLSAVTGLLYCLFMIFTSAITRFEQFTGRLLSPMLVPLIWSLSWWVPGFISQKASVLKGVYGLVVLTVTAWFLNIQLAADYEYYDGVKDAGIPGYREDPFVQSEIVRYIEKNKNQFNPGIPIYSNAGDAFYFISGLPAHQLPVIVFPSKVQDYYHMPNTYLVWFRDLDNPEMPALDSILKNKNMVVLKQLSDGSVYFSK